MTHARRPLVRTSLARVAVAGAAGLATVFAVAPVAVADDLAAPTEPAPSSETPANEAPAEEAPAEETPPPAEDPAPTDEPAPESPVDEAPADEEAPAANLLEPVLLDQLADEAEAEAAPVLGRQQFRVGVQLAPGAVVPDGTTTAGSVFGITINSPDGSSTYTSCKTGVFEAPGVTATYCLDEDGNPQVFTLEAGETAQVQQLSAPAGITFGDEGTRSVDPCEATGDGEDCLVEGTIRNTDLVFTNAGGRPVANGESVRVDHETATVIDVLANDTVPDDPSTALEVVFAPLHGTAAVFTDTDGRQKIRYTPTDDFEGRDAVTYRLSNASGSSQAQVTIDVEDELGEILPIYGSQKYRIGVQVADGSFVPAGSTTAGSVFEITETAPDGTATVTTCTTSGYAFNPELTASSCFDDESDGFGREIPAGVSVSVRQISAPEGQVPDPDTEVLPPCEQNDPCGGIFGTTLEFTTTGLPPETEPDTATTTEGDAVTIDVLANDDSEDPDTNLEIESAPDDGTAVVVGEAAPAPEPEPDPEVPIFPPFELAVPFAGSLAVQYTPRAGFTGTDTFEYAVSNSNGTAVETVTVRVRDGVVEDTDTDDGDVSGDGATRGKNDTNGLLPDTGGADLRLLGLAGLLVAGGGAMTVRSRRRHDDLGV